MTKRQRTTQICSFYHNEMPFDEDSVDRSYDDEMDFKMLNDILNMDDATPENDIRQLKKILMKFGSVQEMEKLFTEVVNQILLETNSN